MNFSFKGWDVKVFRQSDGRIVAIGKKITKTTIDIFNVEAQTYEQAIQQAKDKIR